MKKIVITAAILLLAICSRAQQVPHFSQYMLNPYLANPAVAGSENYIDVRTGWRNQWTGVDGAPKSLYLTAHLPLNKMDNRATAISSPSRWRNGRKALFEAYRDKDVRLEQAHHGAGLSVMTDKAGALKRSDVSLTYAYHLPLTKSLKMSVGLSGGVSVYKVDLSRLVLTDPNDPTYTSGEYNRVKPNITAGALLYSKRYFVGVTSAQILQDELSARDGQAEEMDQSQMHYFLTGGYKVVLSPKLSLLPSVMVKHVRPAPLSADLNLKMLYLDKVWAGASYRKLDSVVLLGGININSLWQVGYAYDMSGSEFGRATQGSHEVVLGILLNNRGKVISPSDFW